MTPTELKSAILAALDKAEALERGATKGPWLAGGLTIRVDRGTIATCPTPQKGGTFDCAQNSSLIAFARNTVVYHLAQDRKLVNATCESCGDTGEIYISWKPDCGYIPKGEMSTCPVCHGSRPAELKELARALGIQL